MEPPRKPPTNGALPVSSKLLKRKEVIIHDVIDLDEDESSAETMICNMKIDARNKGKDSHHNNNFGPGGVATFTLNGLESFNSYFCDGKSFAPGFAPSNMKPTPMDYVSKPPNNINPSLIQPSFNPNSSSSSLNQAHVRKLPPLPPSLQKKFFSWFEGFKKLTSIFSPLYDPHIDLPIPPAEGKNIWGQEYAGSQNKISGSGCALADLDSNSLSGKDRNLEDVLVKFRSFKQFGTVDDHSDHHYVQKGCSVKQPSKVWAKSIQEEWKILEKDLPDTIFVRVYESRMDILRAVIKGADGTPYHDGLFFFDIFFPSDYPNIPPHVHYHAGGLRLNPNLYACGKVCLSLLNTWYGNNNENWIPGKSTMLQVLVSIQGLILNSKPYFNEPVYEIMSAFLDGNKRSFKYNEDTFLLSLKTMCFTMRRPPKHFEDLVVGHFCERAHDILAACKAYMDGAQVGCLIKGGIQDVDEGNKSCSDAFKENVAKYLEVLVMWFKNIGAKDCDKFLPPAKIRSER